MFRMLQKPSDSVTAEDLENLQNQLENYLVDIVTETWALQSELEAPQNRPVTNPKRPSQSKHRSKVIPSKFRESIDETRINRKQIYKNEAPDKLWPFVEQFCIAPTEQQIQDLDEMMKDCDNDNEYFQIPSIEKTPDPGLGALTQRLVSSFIESSDESSASSQAQPKKRKITNNNPKNIDINKAKNLEQRIRKELEEHEILNHQDDLPYGSEDDEVLRELIASQHELLTIQNQNKKFMSGLLEKAKNYSKLEAAREKLREASADVINSYQKLIQARQKKRNLTKDEKETASKALKVHDTIFKQCDELYLTDESASYVARLFS